MARPEILEVDRVALALRTLPRVLGRPALPKDIANLFGVSKPTAGKYVRRACAAGLVEAARDAATPETQTAS
jgi:Mn-dependent DtxR family transcriptional regulator